MTTILLQAPADTRAGQMFGLTKLLADGPFRAAHYTDDAGNKRADYICTPVEGFENILEGFASSVPGFTWEVANG